MSETSTRAPKARRQRQTAAESRLGWILQAYETLERGGVETITIDGLARDLGLTKGSFYGQFDNRDALLDALLDHWRSEMLDYVAMAQRNTALDLRSNLRFVFQLVKDKQLLRFDSAMRAWARANPSAAQIVAEIDAARMAYLDAIFKAAGHSKAARKARAELFYGYAMYLATALPTRPNIEDKPLLDNVIDVIAAPPA